MLALQTARPADEGARMQMMRRFRLTDTPRAAAFDRLAAQAADGAGGPIARVARPCGGGTGGAQGSAGHAVARETPSCPQTILAAPPLRAEAPA